MDLHAAFAGPSADSIRNHPSPTCVLVRVARWISTADSHRIVHDTTSDAPSWGFKAGSVCWKTDGWVRLLGNSGLRRTSARCRPTDG